jgi:hypothetical protein
VTVDETRAPRRVVVVLFDDPAWDPFAAKNGLVVD